MNSTKTTLVHIISERLVQDKHSFFFRNSYVFDSVKYFIIRGYTYLPNVQDFLLTEREIQNS